MANYLMNPDIAKKMSPETRTHNAYQALYLGVESGDPDADKYLKEGLEEAFYIDNVTLENAMLHDEIYNNKSKNKDKHYHYKMDMLLTTASNHAAQQLQPDMLSYGQRQEITQGVTSESGKSKHFYNKLFSNYEHKYGTPADELVLASQVSKVAAGDSEQLAFNFSDSAPSPLNVTLDVAVHSVNSLADSTVKPPERKTERSSGIMYNRASSQSEQSKTVSTRHEYKESESDNKLEVADMIDSLKGDIQDMHYDNTVRSKPNNHSDFTAADDYGFDEPDNDDGLEL